jgi:hypothetical protein
MEQAEKYNLAMRNAVTELKKHGFKRVDSILISHPGKCLDVLVLPVFSGFRFLQHPL